MSRRRSPAVLGLLLCACVPQAALPVAHSAPGAIYDPLGERAGVEEAPASRPAGVRRPHELPSEPPPVLPTFSAQERDRIERVQPLVLAAARQHSLPPDLVNGIIWVESRFRTHARSPKGARGLMQLMPSTGRELARELGMRYAPFDAEFNVHTGSRYFAQLLERFEGNLTLALAAYNIGPGTVSRWLRDAEPLPDRSREYVANVFTAARTFRDRGL